MTEKVSKMMSRKSKMMHEAAEECRKHCKESFERGVWNMAVRRAQEAVELELKSILALLGMDYPKDHDQAPLLMRVLNARGIEIDGYREARQIESISADLSRKRGPALQQEEGYTKEVAENAISGVNYIFDVTKELRGILT